MMNKPEEKFRRLAWDLLSSDFKKDDPMVIEKLLQITRLLDKEDEQGNPLIESKSIAYRLRHLFIFSVSLTKAIQNENQMLDRWLRSQKKSESKRYDERELDEIESLRRENERLRRNDAQRQRKVIHLANLLKRHEPWRNHMEAEASAISYGNLRSAGGGPAQENAVRAMEDAPQALEEMRE